MLIFITIMFLASERRWR